MCPDVCRPLKCHLDGCMSGEVRCRCKDLLGVYRERCCPDCPCPGTSEVVDVASMSKMCMR